MESSLGPSCSADLVVRHSLAQIRTSGLGNLWVVSAQVYRRKGKEGFVEELALFLVVSPYYLPLKFTCGI